MSQSLQPLEGKPVFVALDQSERSTPCLRYGCDMAAKLDQPLLLVHVVHETTETAGMYRRYHGTHDTTPLADIARKMFEERVASFRESCDELDRICEVRLIVVEGIPGTRIPELAQHYDAGLIVMCSHNRKGIDRWLHGSVTEAVMRRATCPVVIIDKEEIPIRSPLSIRQPVAHAAEVAHGI